MGKFLKIQKLTTFAEGGLIALGVIVVLVAVYIFAPGLHVSESKQLNSLTLSSDKIDNIAQGEKLDFPTSTMSTAVASKPLVVIKEYAWNGNSGKIVANGGPRTTKGSIMESLGVNLKIERLDEFVDLRNSIVTFVEEYNKGVAYPTNEKAAAGVSIMGDGAPFFITTTQQILDEKFGKGKYHVQVVGAYGLSYGEDKLIGPKKWKDNPQSMRGALISGVIGDGDWVIAVNYASANKIPINPDPSTYDANAINFVPAEADNYINAVKQLIASQTNGVTISLKEVKDGKLTGKTVDKIIDGTVTWTPGDKIALDALTGFTDVVTTADFNNQMATTLIMVKEWALQNEKTVSNILKGAYIGSNQIKLYDDWAVKASQAVYQTYNFESPQYWYRLFKGVDTVKAGTPFHIGGSRVFNYADAMQYYGISDGVNRYKSVYEQVSKYLTGLNPSGFNETCKDGVVPYDDAVNLYFLKSINDINAGKSDKADYTQEKTTVLASGEWSINFNSGSAAIMSSSNKDLESIYNLLVQAEDTKLSIIGHTDNTGNSDKNVTLSHDRADAVVTYLTNKGIPSTRFQFVDGRGDKEPVNASVDNNSVANRAKNRRVQITLLK